LNLTTVFFQHMNKIYLLLGSNMGNSRQCVATAVEQINRSVGIVKHMSNYYQTAAWGNTEQPDFLNQVVLVYSLLNASECLDQILAIEKRMGRIRTVKNAPRIIDIDILYFNEEIIDKRDLVVPHPAIADRRFVLVPLNEISPQFIHPVHKRSNHQLLLECQDLLGVKKIAD
jgi:2-amino-4-hydroxy-6-hydroxymethyldihydropteridine diphosphokinase